jgi:5-methylcytosine-specific restriction endonuclease McrA
MTLKVDFSPLSEHVRKGWCVVPRQRKRVYDAAWTRLSRLVRAQAGGRCEVVTDGRRCPEPATSTDHIVPVSEAPHLRLERSNLRASCAKHNMGRAQRRLARRARINRSQATVRDW